MSRLKQAAGVLSLPPALAHELTHYLVASIETDDAQFAVEVSGGRALAAWPPLESRVVRVFAFLGPTAFGSILALVWLLSGADFGGWRALFVLGLAIYTLPSPADVRGALGRQTAQQNYDSSTDDTDSSEG